MALLGSLVKVRKKFRLASVLFEYLHQYYKVIRVFVCVSVCCLITLERLDRFVNSVLVTGWF